MARGLSLRAMTKTQADLVSDEAGRWLFGCLVVRVPSYPAFSWGVVTGVTRSSRGRRTDTHTPVPLASAHASWRRVAHSERRILARGARERSCGPRDLYQLCALFPTPFPALGAPLASDRLRSVRGSTQGNGFVQSERRSRPVPVSADRWVEPRARDGVFSACGRS